MKFHKSKFIYSIVCALFLNAILVQATELKKSDYIKKSNEMGVILIDVNWGRQWNCGGYENAQLESLRFENVSLEGEAHNKYTEIKLESPSRLFVKNHFLNYGFIVKPGKYAFTEWSIKDAKSVQDVGYLKASHDEMVDGEIYHGGTFEVGANEIIYIGNMFLDCLQSPIPWRYYTEGKANFKSHIKQGAVPDN